MDEMVGLVNVAYRAIDSKSAWLRRVAAAARPLLDRGDGVFACLLDGSSDGISFSDPVLLGCPPKIWELALESSTRLTPEEQAANLRQPQTYATVSQRLGPHGTFAKHWMYAGYRDCGLSDFALLTSTDVDGRGVVLGAPLRRISASSRRERKRWTFVGAHLRAAFRLIATADGTASVTSTTQAVLKPDGRIEDAPGDQSGATREALRRAVIGIERARAARLPDDGSDPLELWRALVAGRWSLIDHFDSDGKRFLVARANEPRAEVIESSLTRRETQIVAYVRLGHSNKLIAYELGLSPASVSEHLANAMLKLGVSSRAHLVAGYAGDVNVRIRPA